jgi:hypothetical protein
MQWLLSIKLHNLTHSSEIPPPKLELKPSLMPVLELNNELSLKPELELNNESSPKLCRPHEIMRIYSVRISHYIYTSNTINHR